MIDDRVEFPTTKKGFDPDAVHEYLTSVRRTHTEELRARDREISDLRAAVAAARERDEAVHMTLVAATRARDEMLASVQSKADELLAAANDEAGATLKEAKLEAFRLVTEAREDATSILDEAARMRAAVPEAETAASKITEDAETNATSIVAEARREAMRILSEAQANASEIEDGRTAELRMHRDALVEETAALEAEVSHLRTRLAELEARASRAESDEAPNAREHNGVEHNAVTKTRFVSGTARPAPEAHEDAPLEVVAHESPALAATEPAGAVAEAASEEPEADAPRGSFYSRRSAKLPRIGDESGRNALTSMAGLRSHVNATTFGEDEEEDHRRDRDDLAVQPASA